MTVVFVHGVPETAELWDGVRAALRHPSEALQLPGFASPAPAEFVGDKDAYVHHVLEQLATIPGPIDLVGHDWGSLITARIATAFGSRIRSWAADIGALWHRDYVWHDFALLWQASPQGEEWVAQTMREQRSAESEGFFAVLGGLGVPDDHAPGMREAFTEHMARSILGLYRSAAPNIDADWNLASPVDLQPQGLILQAANDPFDDLERSTEVARALGAGVARLTGVGHFWMLQDPAGAADVVSSWIDRVEAGLELPVR
ncbi:alpha/beta fold hydrolase [Gordonia rubripertincta]|uniref:Alpha/beta hydrolase n=1 Tax=Gordonia rubripertincta TaxID=36822 RepID=A0ABT4MVK2_GORRU|nr:alpha/beta hydrolase [Gordonia rubripertincta]MCZ4551038.1 alpha/beta hydrolase [Gordonia rubripertincta]